MISKEVFCKALSLIQEQHEIDLEVGLALEKVGDGRFLYGVGNKYYEALLLVLKAAMDDKYDYISWWLYDGAPEYEVTSADETQKWILKEPDALYDYITSGG